MNEETVKKAASDWLVNYDLSKSAPEGMGDKFPITQAAVIDGINHYVESKKFQRTDTRHLPGDLVAECLFLPGSIVGVVLKDAAIETRNVAGGFLNMALTDLGTQGGKLADKLLKDDMRITKEQYSELHSSLVDLQSALRAKKAGKDVDLEPAFTRFASARDAVVEEAVDKEATKEIMDKVKGGVQKAKGILDKFRNKEGMEQSSAIPANQVDYALAQIGSTHLKGPS